MSMALNNLKDAVEFWRRVQKSSEDEKIAVGRDHYNWLISAAMIVADEHVRTIGQ